MPTTLQPLKTQDSLTYNSAARIVEMYRQAVQSVVFIGDVGSELTGELRACIYAEGFFQKDQTSDMSAAQRWQAVAQAMFAIDMLERCAALPIRRRNAPEGTHGVILEIGAAQYLLGITPNAVAAERLRERLHDCFGPVPAELEMRLL